MADLTPLAHTDAILALPVGTMLVVTQPVRVLHPTGATMDEPILQPGQRFRIAGKPDHLLSVHGEHDAEVYWLHREKLLSFEVAHG
jgi:hypothetical protein